MKPKIGLRPRHAGCGPGCTHSLSRQKEWGGVGGGVGMPPARHSASLCMEGNGKRSKHFETGCLVYPGVEIGAFWGTDGVSLSFWKGL